eukprot:CAMPEP_0195524092 /NCGR_PEP_ID=MMETSP0794_2-20130614/23758_1 /TAXON_ID=515487 /ORGANISM="Stephanopyxis turris, Strain CCMP 815" /LENGTH=333 /DNA_ID=CAMNT_0040654249 /DNA_START=93 /DNA_END=1094 /DNA_ORIENTATION=+
MTKSCAISFLFSAFFLLDGASSFGMTMMASSGTKASTLPKDVKAAVSLCRGSVQKALEQKMSRMAVDMPAGAKFGVEKIGGKKKGKVTSDGTDGVTKADFDRSDRELCRIFVEMFQPLGGDHIVSVFNEESLAEKAKKIWKGDISTSCKIMTTGKKGKDKSAKKKKKAAGFAAKMNAEMASSAKSTSGPFALPENTELALFVAPGPKELVIIERICSEVGMGTCVILLNARLSSNPDNFANDEAKAFFTEEFEDVFHLAAAPQEAAPNCLVHRAYPNDWVLARKPKVGPPKVIAESPVRPDADQCKDAYENVEIGEFEGAVEGVLENVANWFK